MASERLEWWDVYSSFWSVVVPASPWPEFPVSF